MVTVKVVQAMRLIVRHRHQLYIQAGAKREKDALTLMKNASKEEQGCREFVLAAVKDNGDALYYASQELQGDREVVLAAVRNYGDAIEYASEELRGDREVVMEAVSKPTEMALFEVSAALKNDTAIVKECILHSPWQLKHASPRLQEELLYARAYKW